jgi:hypothetical protein
MIYYWQEYTLETRRENMAKPFEESIVDRVLAVTGLNAKDELIFLANIATKTVISNNHAEITRVFKKMSYGYGLENNPYIVAALEHIESERLKHASSRAIIASSEVATAPLTAH